MLLSAGLFRIPKVIEKQNIFQQQQDFQILPSENPGIIPSYNLCHREKNKAKKHVDGPFNQHAPTFLCSPIQDPCSPSHAVAESIDSGKARLSSDPNAQLRRCVILG